MHQIDLKHDVRTAEIKEILAIEKSLMKDELLDEIISAMRHGGKYPSPKASGESVPPPATQEPPTSQPPTDGKGPPNPGKSHSNIDDLNTAARDDYPGVSGIINNLNQTAQATPEGGQEVSVSLTFHNVHILYITSTYILLSMNVHCS